MVTEERPSEVLPPPPKSRKKGWKPVPGDPYRVRYWDGKQWTDKYEKTGDAGRLLTTIFPQERPSYGWFAGILFGLMILLLIIYFWVIRPGGGDGETRDTSTTTQAATTEAVTPGAEGATTTTPPATAATQAPATGGGGEGTCVVQTFMGGVQATFPDVVGTNTQHSESRIVIAPDCTAKVTFVLLEAGVSDKYVSATNPEGNFCAMVEGDGTLTFQPDSGALSGTLAVYPMVASSHSFDGLCPAPDRVGSYVLEGVSGDFSGSVTGTTLSGSGMFDHRQIPVGVSITATAGG